MYQVTLCVRVTRIVLSVASCAHTRKCTRADGWVASKGVFFGKYICYILVVSHNCSYSCFLQNIETDRCFLWFVSIFYLHQFLPSTLQTSDTAQTNLQMHQVSDTYRPMLKCSFFLVYDPILYNIYIYTYTYIYIYVAYLYSNYCRIFGILTAFSGCYYLDVNPYPWIPLDHILTAGRVKYIYIYMYTYTVYNILLYIYILLLNYQSDVFLVFFFWFCDCEFFSENVKPGGGTNWHPEQPEWWICPKPVGAGLLTERSWQWKLKKYRGPHKYIKVNQKLFGGV